MRRALALALVAGLVALACSDSYLYDPRRQEDVPLERSLALEARFCTPGPNEVRRPLKLLVAMDASQSMRVTDPDGTRASALLELLETLPREPEVYVSVLLFAGSTSKWLTRSQGPDFDQLVSLTDAERLGRAEALLNFANPDVNRDSTDFVKALADIYGALNRDIARARETGEGPARYSVIFLSDGAPSEDQDGDLLQGDAVKRIRQLRELAEDVRLNTVHVFLPTQPVGSVCDLSPDAGSGCPLLLINANAARLEAMAALGGGDFRDFRNNEPINFLSFRFGQVRRAWRVKEVVATNRAAPAGTPLLEGDVDGDRLVDVLELEQGLEPYQRDTDGDGFSDGVEVHFSALGAPFTPDEPVQPDGGGGDPGCPPTLRGMDSDCDGLLDCDEQLVGSNAEWQDSDSDGIPDGVEWQLGTQASSADLDADPDNDGLPTREEVRLHMNPLVADTEHLSRIAYRYRLEPDGPEDAEGRQCFLARVDNMGLVPTEADTRDGGTGRGPGFNEVWLSVAFVPADEEGARTLVRTARATARFPVAGIKSPADGVLQLAPEDFVEGCLPGLFP